MSACLSQPERYRGSLLGLAVGDALGAPLEGLPPGSFEPLDDMVGGGFHDIEPGQWTDDTSLALCLAESLVEKRGFDPVDQLERYVRWFREGHLSSKGYCFGIGNTTMEALLRFEETGEPYSGSTEPDRAGNGSIMRLAPVPLFFAQRSQEAIERSAESSLTTHGAREAVDGCRYLGALLAGAASGAGKEELLSERYCPVSGYWEENPLAPRIDRVASGSFKRKEPPEIKGSGYVVRSLEAALWAFHTHIPQFGGRVFVVFCRVGVHEKEDTLCRRRQLLLPMLQSAWITWGSSREYAGRSGWPSSSTPKLPTRARRLASARLP